MDSQEVLRKAIEEMEEIFASDSIAGAEDLSQDKAYQREAKRAKKDFQRALNQSFSH